MCVWVGHESEVLLRTIEAKFVHATRLFRQVKIMMRQSVVLLHNILELESMLKNIFVVINKEWMSCAEYSNKIIRKACYNGYTQVV